MTKINLSKSKILVKVCLYELKKKHRKIHKVLHKLQYEHVTRAYSMLPFLASVMIQRQRNNGRAIHNRFSDLLACFETPFSAHIYVNQIHENISKLEEIQR